MEEWKELKEEEVGEGWGGMEGGQAGRGDTLRLPTLPGFRDLK